MNRALQSILLATAIAAAPLPCISGTNSTDQVHNISLTVVSMFDKRLPALTSKDVADILAEAERVIAKKLAGGTTVSLVYVGEKPFRDLFTTTYRHGKKYATLKPWRYDRVLAEKTPILLSDQYEQVVTQFLRQWPLEELRDFFPSSKVSTYGDVYRHVMATYHKKVRALGRLETKDGDPLLLPEQPPFQSYVEWLAAAHEQDKYDIILTNTLIVYDLLSCPYPHTVCKHAKVGGSSFTSPRRRAMGGRALMVNILEEYGNVKELNPRAGDTPRALRNKILGGFYLAHEFGHAFYLIPDVYDHGGACLMNSAFDAMDARKGYELLTADMSACPKCRPWIDAKHMELQAISLEREGNHRAAGYRYLECALRTPAVLDVHRRTRLGNLLRQAIAAFKKAEDTVGIEKCREAARALSIGGI